MAWWGHDCGGGGGGGMCWGGCDMNFTCCCSNCGGDQYTGCSQSCFMDCYIASGGNCYPGTCVLLDTNQIGACDPTNPCNYFCDQAMAGNADGTPGAVAYDEYGNPVDSCGNPITDCGSPSPYVCTNKGAGTAPTQGGRSASSGGGGAPSGGGGGGAPKPPQQRPNQPGNAQNNMLNSLLNTVSKLGTNLIAATQNANTVNRAVVGKPQPQIASMAGKGDMIIVVMIVILLGSMLFIEQKEG